MNMSTEQNKGIICDSNIWIAAFNKDDSQHKKATALLRDLQQQPGYFIIPNYIDLECVSLLTVRSSFEIAELWKQFRNTTTHCQFLFFDPEDHHNIIQLHFKTKKRYLSCIDISLLYLKKNGYQVYTFDKKLKKIL